MTLPGRILTTILLLTVTCGSIHAQLCQGSLGDPLVNITFGSGPNPGAPLTAAATSYQFTSTDCPNDGYYTVRSNTDICFSSSWHTLSSDHTGNANGYFMLVNASYQPGAFYIDTVKALCSGTTYEFAAWIVNVLRSSACSFAGIQPNLTFTIEKTDGTVIQTYSTGNINSEPVATWRQYGFFFTTPVAVSDIVLRIVNNSPGGCGNDLALDDITFRPCGPQISVNIAGVAQDTAHLCEGMAHSFQMNGAISAGFNNPSYQWQQSESGGAWTDIAGETGLSLTRDFLATSAPGSYGYRLSAAEAGNMNSQKCRVVSRPLAVIIHANPVTAVTGNTPLCEDKTLSVSATGGTSYQWTGPAGFIFSGDKIVIPDARTYHSGRYHVLVSSDAGCTHEDSIDITVNVNPVANVSITSATICEGDQLPLAGNGGTSYSWTPAAGLSSATVPNPIAAPGDTTNYQLVVANQFSCTDTAYVLVNVIEKPRANAGPDRYIMKGQIASLSASVSGQNVSFSWSPAAYMNTTHSLQPAVSPPFDATYDLEVVSNEGCGTASDKVRVFVYPDVYVPNAFSPNNDGINDTWSVPALKAWTEYSVAVYNRYGQIVFQTKNAARDWDGKYKGLPQPIGAYVYFIDLKNGERLLKGTVSIVR